MSARSRADFVEFEDPARWADEHGDALLRFALVRVRQKEMAEDLVQDAMLAAWSARHTFDGRSGLRTWLIGILRRKIADHYRRVGREPTTVASSRREMETLYFDDRGKWIAPPRRWSPSPDRIAEDSEFGHVLRSCFADMPTHLSQAFELRELRQMPLGEVCGAVGISAKNASVRLHRARLLLRECLERRWFC